MKSPFTPAFIYQKQRRKVQALVLVLALVPLLIHQLTMSVSATATTTWDSTNFEAGTNVHTSIDAGGISLTATATSSDETYADFSLGDATSGGYLALTKLLAGGGVEIGQGSYTYPTYGTEMDISAVNQTFFANDLLYVSTQYAGLVVIDTQGTTDPADDTLVTRYNTGSTPALASNQVENTFMTNNLLYVSTGGGLTVIDTQGTTDPSDDVLVTNYTTGSTPALASNFVKHTFLANNLLYVSTGYGISIIDTQGTLSPVDDTLVIRYYKNYTLPLWLDTDVILSSSVVGNLLYISTRDTGLVIFDTKGTVTAADDTRVIRKYPGIASNHVYSTFINNNLLYVSTRAGLYVFDTKGTNTTADDTLVKRYYTGSTPALLGDDVTSTIIDNGLLYIGVGNPAYYSSGGLAIIDTKGTVSAADDTLSAVYNTDSTPSLPQSAVTNVSLNNGNFYVSSGYYLSVIIPEAHRPSGTFIGAFRRMTESPARTITMDATIDDGQAAALSYRTGVGDAIYRNDFNDGTTTELLGDFYDWDIGLFDTTTETNGTIRFSNPDAQALSNQSVYAWFDTGYLDNHFATGTIVTARVRLNSDTTQYTGLTLFNDDWWDEVYIELENNEWQTISFTADTRAFSKIGFFLEWGDAWGGATDSLEIDWIKIEPFPEVWSAWTACSGSTCLLGDLGTKDWYQYKLDLTTDDTSASPVVHSVAFSSPRQSSGTYTSDTTVFEKPQDLLTFDAEVSTSTGTDVSFEYSIDAGSTWNAISSGQSLTSQNVAVTSFTWRATLTTDDIEVTPTITSVTLGTTIHVDAGSTTSTSVKARAAFLEENGNADAAAELRAKYPHLFDGTARPEEIQKAIIVRLKKVVVLYKKLKILREEEE